MSRIMWIGWMLLTSYLSGQDVQRHIDELGASMMRREWSAALTIAFQLDDMVDRDAERQILALALGSIGRGLREGGKTAEALRAHEAGLRILLALHEDEDRVDVATIRNGLVPRTGRELVLSPVAPYDHACAWEGVMHVLLCSRADAS